MGAQSFRDVSAYAEDYTAGFRGGQAFRAFWAVVLDKTLGGPRERQEALHKWKNDVVAQLLEWREPITRVQRMNSMLYRGKHYFSQEDFSNLPYNRNKQYSKNQAKIVLNHLGQATDQHVSDMCAYEPNLTVMPSNDEESDRVNARMNKQALDFYFYELKLKTAFAHFHRRKKVQGETFAFVLWDPDIGDLHPKYKEWRKIQREMGQEPDMPVPLIDPETGSEVMGADGKPLFVMQPVRVGDVSVEWELSERVLYPCPESYLWEDVPWLIRLRWMDVDEVKARWPHAAEHIKHDSLYRRYMGPTWRSLHQKVCVRFMYHKPTRFLPDGYYCASTESIFLEGEQRNVANHPHLPVIRGTDIDLDYEITGMSFYQNLASLNAGINNSTSMILQNQSLFAYPKYTAPRGAKVKFADLGDDRGIYEYSGPRGPELIANNSTPADTWRWRDALRDEFKTLSGIYATSMGQAPDGITANVALRMIDEQERKFHKPHIDKHGANVELLGSLILATLGTYRDPSDGAMIKVLGKNNERYLRYFDGASLGRPYEVRLVRSSGLPENPAAKTQTVLDFAERFPEMWTHDEVLEYLDIARPEKLIESATVARQAAESEVEDILSGVPNVRPPQSYHDILPRYRVYEKAVQSRAFDEADPLVQQRMMNHIITAEYLIQRKIKLNPTFAQLVIQKHPNFPMFFPMEPQIQPFQLAQPSMPMMGRGDGAPLAGIPPEMAVSAPMGAGPQDTAGNPSIPIQQPLEQPNIPDAGVLP